MPTPRRSLALLVVFIVILTTSCGKEEFAAPTIRDQQSPAPIVYRTKDLCTGHSLVKPKVDFLFLWDNSSSQLFVTPATKKALNNTINYISGQFDYHVLLAPLMKSAGTDAMYLLVDNEKGLSSSAKTLVVPQNTASEVINFPFVGGAREDGAGRVIQIIQDNIANGIFRNQANTIVVLMSNGDDNSFVPPGGIITGIERDNYLQQTLTNLSTLSNTTLQASLFRFISLVAFSTCVNGYQENYVYRNISKVLYGNYLAKLPANSNSSANDQQNKSWPDSYDICSTDFAHLFDGINNSITAVLVGHAYDYWPIGSNTEPDFDPGRIQAKKKYANVELLQNDPNGFTYVGFRENQNTRYLPEPGEPYTGHLIKLSGTGIVQYPECLIVTTQTPASYYGFLQLHFKPLVSSIKIKINGVDIPESTTNGWEYIGFKDNQNVKIQGPSAPHLPGLPAEEKTGYFLKMNGSAIYTNGADIEIIYDPSA